MYLEKLEFSKILEMLSHFCLTSQGKELSIHLLPNHQKETVTKLLAQTAEAVNLSYRNGFPYF